MEITLKNHGIKKNGSRIRNRKLLATQPNRKENNKSFCVSSGILIMKHFLCFISVLLHSDFFSFLLLPYIRYCCFFFALFDVCHILVLFCTFHSVLIIISGKFYVRQYFHQEISNEWLLLCAYHSLHFISMPHNTQTQLNFQLTVCTTQCVCVSSIVSSHYSRSVALVFSSFFFCVLCLCSYYRFASTEK